MNIFGKISDFYGNDRATKVIYGSILLFVVILSIHYSGDESAFMLAFTVFLTSFTIVLAEIYSEILGQRIKQHGKLSRAERTNIVNDTLSIVSVSLWPSVIFLLSAFGLYSLDIAYGLSYAFLLIVLFGFSYLAYRLGQNSPTKSLIISFATVAIGLLIIWFKFAIGGH